MFTCASCKIHACKYQEAGELPQNCPMRLDSFYPAIQKQYQQEGLQEFYVNAAYVESEGYCRWPRVRETIEFCKKMGYHKIGVAFCIGLSKEAEVFCNLLRQHGFEVSSVICSNGGIDKKDMGIPREKFVRPAQERETGCNPIGQAELLKRDGTEFNVVIGLCVGHDSLFLKHSHVMATVLIAKDRALGHNPAAALYCAEGYMKSRLEPEK